MATLKITEGLTFDDVSLVPIRSSVETRSNCSTKVSLWGYPLECPIIPSNMVTVTGMRMMKFMNSVGGIGVLPRFGNCRQDFLNMWEESRYTGKPIKYSLSVGVNNLDDEMEFLNFYAKDEDLKFVIIDVANGHNDKALDALVKYKKEFSGIPFVAGNVCTYMGATDLLSCGADGIKVGVGNGSACETRIRTGVGVPQFTALQACVSAVEDENLWGEVLIICDGGVTKPGDVAKALAAGANLVMSGSLFAATKEAAPEFVRQGVWPNEKIYKPYYGSASEQAKGTSNVEGNGTLLPYKGSANRIMKGLLEGLRSSMSYLNATNLEEFYKNSIFMRISNSSKQEAVPYILNIA